MMKKNLSILLTLFAVIGFTPKAEAFLDMFVVYGKRNNQINEMILEALSTPRSSWKRVRVPVTEEYESYSTYIPGSSNEDDSKKQFFFTELRHAKHPSLHTLNDLFKNDNKSVEKINSEKPKIIHNSNKIIEVSAVSSANTISSEENSIAYEITTINRKRDGVVKYSTNFMGESNSEFTFNDPAKEDLKEYNLIWTIDLGNRNFRNYMFRSKDTIPTPEEKKYLLDLFRYMEAQIANVK